MSTPFPTNWKNMSKSAKETWIKQNPSYNFQQQPTMSSMTNSNNNNNNNNNNNSSSVPNMGGIPSVNNQAPQNPPKSSSDFLSQLASTQKVKFTDRTVSIMDGFLNQGQDQTISVNWLHGQLVNLVIPYDALLMILYCYKKTGVDSSKRTRMVKVSETYSVHYDKYFNDWKSVGINAGAEINETMFVRQVCLTRVSDCLEIYNDNKKKLSGSKALPFFLGKLELLTLVKDQIACIKSATRLINSGKPKTDVIDKAAYLSPFSLFGLLDSYNPKEEVGEIDKICIGKALWEMAQFLGLQTEFDKLRDFVEMCKLMQNAWRDSWSILKTSSGIVSTLDDTLFGKFKV